MIASPANVRLIGDGLDHPEDLCLAPDGAIYAGGEAGQVYRLDPDGSQTQIATTGGFLLGVALDGGGNLHVCDLAQKAVIRVTPNGQVSERSKGAPDHPFTLPNYGVFDAEGNFYVSDSGEYWHETGTGAVLVIRPDGTTEVFHAGPFRFANGLALDPTGRWLSVAQSTAGNVVRIPLDRPNGPVEVTHTLPPHTVPDGLAYTDDGRLIIACYRPDVIYLGHPDGRIETLLVDHTSELLLRPTNVALADDGRLHIANLGGWNLSVFETGLRPGPIHLPELP